MNTMRHVLRRLRFRLVGGLAVPLLLPWALEAPAANYTSPSSGSCTTGCPTEILHLADCVSLALERQPNIAAQRASLASATTSQRALNNLRCLGLIQRDLPTRRQQSSLGVVAATAAVDRAEHETIYAVTRMYYSVLYAREQQLVANDIVERLKNTKQTAENFLKAGNREVTQDTVDKIGVYLALAATRQAEANRGLQRAGAALREAIGFGPECTIRIPGEDLHVPQANPTLNDIVEKALTHRAELVQVTSLSQITCLETKAQQALTFNLKAPTFAAGADIHSQLIPSGSSNGEYRPGGLAPEMPTTLVGSRNLRVERAQDLYGRSQAVIDKTRNLIALEAEDAFFKWEEANSKVAMTQTAQQMAKKLADATLDGFRNNQKVKPEDVLTNQILAAQARAAYNEARYQLIISLAGLERVTAGGFPSGLTAPK